MAKSFKLRLSRVIPTFHSCRSKDTSTFPANPNPSFLCLSPKINGPRSPASPPFPAPPRPSSSIRRHVSSAITSVGCGLGPKPSRRRHSGADVSSGDRFYKEDEWHVLVDPTPRRKIYNTPAAVTSDDGGSPPRPPPPTAEKRKKRRARKMRANAAAARALRLSTSSADSCFYFSSERSAATAAPGADKKAYEEEEEETETLVSSSRSFSTEESGTSPEVFYTRRKKKERKEGKERRRRGVKAVERTRRRSVASSTSGEESEPAAARLSVFKRLIPCGVEGKVRESFAVVKRSEEPYEDFRRSMMEMIMEKNMYEKEDLEQLLRCFLSLNAREHHAAIVGAFSEVWETLFP